MPLETQKGCNILKLKVVTFFSSQLERQLLPRESSISRRDGEKRKH